MKLNLGAGDDYREGYVNIDLREDCGADEVGDVTKLRFADESVDEVLALDLLEHFPVFRTLDILAEWHRVLRSGGTLTLKVPNLQALAEALVTRTLPDVMVRNIYGGHRWGLDGAWDAHHTGWTPTMLRRDLELAKFKVVAMDDALNMTVTAVKT